MSDSPHLGRVRPLVATALCLSMAASVVVAPMSLAAPQAADPDTLVNEALRARDIDSPAQPSSPQSYVAPRGEVPRAKINWRRCSDAPELQCGTIKVPKNWNKPRKGAKNTVTLAMRRLPAKTKAKRPTLFMNPGGPGGSGTQTLTGLASSFKPLRSSYNVVSWDPRGVPDSSPLPRKCQGAAQVVTPTTGSFNWAKAFGTRYRATAKQLASCIKVNKNVAKWIGTNQVVRDLDVMRRAVGDKKLSYLGYSYGTTIGRTYQLTFPKRVRVMILDGVTDPTVQQNQDAQYRMKGSTTAWKMLRRGLKPGVRTSLDKVSNYLQKKTAKLPDGNTISRWTWWSGLINSARNQESVAALPVLVCTVAKFIDVSNPTCDSYVPKTLRGTSNAIDLLKRLAKKPLESPVLQLVNCADSRGNLNSQTAGQWVQRTARYGGPEAASNNLNYLAVCAGQKTGWDSLPGLTKRTKVPSPPLVVNGVGDVATSYLSARETHKLFTGSKMITVDTTVHGLSLIAGSSCVDRVVLKYLRTTKLPSKNSKCGALPS